MPKTPSELHLSIIWEKARHQQAAILDRLSSDFRLRAVFEIHWQPELFTTNLSRFYGQALPPGSEKHRHCGDGAFLLVLFNDDAPAYLTRETLAGERIVNSRVFDFKQTFRNARAGGLPLHATNDPQEVAHDLMLLLHRSAQTLDAELPATWDKHIVTLQQDVLGANGWPDLATLFCALNHCGRYVVLRNFDHLPAIPCEEGHDDIDLLCEHVALAHIANGRKVHDTPHGVHFAVCVEGREIRFDFRHLGDSYYCDAFAKRILERRELDPRGFYRPCAEDHYYALLYHALLHKPAFGKDYLERLNQARTGTLPQLTGDRLQALDVLDDHWARHGFAYPAPLDTSVTLEAELLRCYADALDLERIGDEVQIAKLLNRPPVHSRNDLPRGRPSTHISPLRANVLRPFRSKLHGRVLEVGAGSGALTRFIAETAQTVLAVEPSHRMRSLAELRCANAQNVRFSDALPQQPEAFDAIVVVGQLPFASRFVAQNSANAAQELIADLSTLLKPDGTLILAEENLLGLHQLSDAIANTPSHLASLSADSRRLGRKTLADLLTRSGLSHTHWHYAFPDVRETETIIDDALHDATDFDIVGLVSSALSAPRTLRSRLGFPLERAWQAIQRNGLGRDLCNTFVVLCSHQPDTPHANGDERVLALHFANERLPQHAKVVEFLRHSSGYTVRHRHLYPESQPASQTMLRARSFDEPYILGTPWQQTLVDRLSRPGWRFSAIEEWAATWLAALKQHPDFPQGIASLRSDTPVPGTLIDAIGRNLIIDAAGKAHFFDQEWSLSRDLPLGYVLFRGIFLSMMSVQNVAPPAPGVPTQALGMFVYLTQQLGIPVSRGEIPSFVSLEQDFQRQAAGWGWQALSKLDAYQLQIARPGRDHTEATDAPASPVQAHAEEPENPDRTAYEKAAALIAAGNTDEGLLALIEQAQNGSMWWATYNDLGAHAFRSGSVEDAENLLLAAVELEPTPAEASYNLAKVRIAQHRRDDALALLGNVAKANPQRIDVLADIRSVLSGYDDIPPVVWARLMSSLRSGSSQ